MQYPAVMCFFLFKDMFLRFKQWVVTIRAKLKGKSCKEIMKFKWMKNQKNKVADDKQIPTSRNSQRQKLFDIPEIEEELEKSRDNK